MRSKRELKEFWIKVKPLQDKYNLAIRYYLVDDEKERLNINGQVMYISCNSVYASIQEVKNYIEYFIEKHHSQKLTKHFKDYHNNHFE